MVIKLFSNVKNIDTLIKEESKARIKCISILLKVEGVKKYFFHSVIL